MRTWFPCFAPCYEARRSHEPSESPPVVAASVSKDPQEHVPEAPSQKNELAPAPTVQELAQLGDVLRTFSGIPGSSYHQLGRICALLAERFHVAYVSASVLSVTGITFLPVVAGGRLARVCPLGLPQFLDASRVTSFYHVAGQQRFLRRRVPGDELPSDWEALREAGGLSSFLAAAITVGSETVAVLTLADEDPDKFSSPVWQTSLELVSAFLGHLFRDRQLVGYCGVVEELMVVESLDDLVRTLSRCVVRLQSDKLHLMRLTCRIACIASDASSAIIFDEVLPYNSVLASGMEESMGPGVRGGGGGAGGAGGGAPGFSSAVVSGPAPGGMGGGGFGQANDGGSGASPGAEMPYHLPPPPLPPLALGRGSHTPRGRMARLSMVSPSSHDPNLAALVAQYQVQMHTAANLVPDPPDPTGTGTGPGTGQGIGIGTTQHPYPGPCGGPGGAGGIGSPGPGGYVGGVGRLQSLGGALGPSGGVGGGGGGGGGGRGAAGSGAAGMGGMVYSGVSQPGLVTPGGRLGASPSTGPGGCISLPGAPGGVYCRSSLTGDGGREAALWSALDPGLASNFSQQQLQVEGQTYLVDNTLLSEAIANRAGVWIGDCVAFMQNATNPNADVFLAATTHHTTAMLLAVMWGRSGGGGGRGGSGAAAAAAAAAAGSGAGGASGSAGAPGTAGGGGGGCLSTASPSTLFSQTGGLPRFSRRQQGLPSLWSGPHPVAPQSLVQGGAVGAHRLSALAVTPAGSTGVGAGGVAGPGGGGGGGDGDGAGGGFYRKGVGGDGQMGSGQFNSGILAGNASVLPVAQMASDVTSGPASRDPCNLHSGVGVPSSLPSNVLSNPHSNVLAAFGSTFPRPSPQSNILAALGSTTPKPSPSSIFSAAPTATTAVAATDGISTTPVPPLPLPSTAESEPALPFAIAGDLLAGAVGQPSPESPLSVPAAATSPPAAGMLTSGEPSDVLLRTPSPGALTTLGRTSGLCGVRAPGGDQPLLAFYLLTSGSASPSVLQELLVGLRELLVVLEPLVSSKLSDELSNEWLQLQQEVLDKSKILTQPKDRTIVLRNTAAQLGNVLNSHCSVGEDIASSILVSESLRPPSPSPRPQMHAPGSVRHTASGGAGGGGGGGGGSSAIPIANGVGGAGGNAAAASAAGMSPGGGGGGSSCRAEALRSVSERAMSVGGPMGMGLAGGSSTGGVGGGQAVGGGGGGVGAARQRTPSFLMSRSFTGKRISALISGVQDRVQQAQRLSVSYNTMFSRPADLRSITMLEKLGSGGFGTVYLGLYQSTEVAVKVIFEGDCEGTEVLRNAVELAVLSTLSHPNIVQVLTFFTDVTAQIPPTAARLSGAAPPIYLFPHEPSTFQLDLTPLGSTVADSHCQGGAADGLLGGSKGSGEDSGGGGSIAAEAAGCQKPDGQKQPPQPAFPAPTNAPTKKALVILMEYCDAGCLGDAIRNGVFREKVKGGYGAQQPAWSHIYLTMLEVALALRYLHSINLVHRDLKPQNVLLKSSPSDVRGFTTKLSDFGLVKLLTEADMMATAASAAPGGSRRQRRYSGTVSHVAPEAIQQGGGANPVDVAVDIYAFGIVMWEILTGQPVYLGLTSDQIIEKVQHDGLRPTFPPDTPPDYTSLANRCWDVDPRRRPTAEELVQHMSALSTATLTCKASFAARRRLSTLTNKELLRNVANANLAAANYVAAAAAAAQGGGGGGRTQQRHNEDDFPLHIL